MKTKYKLLLTGVALFSFVGLKAQTISLGAEGEVTTSSVKISGIPNSAVQLINGKNIMGYEIGPYLKLGLGALYVKPKFLISHQSGTVQSIDVDGNSADVSFDVTKLDIPVLVGLKVIGPFSIEAGPDYGTILSATKTFNGENIDLSRSGLGYRVGANAQFGMIGLNVAYQGIKNNSSASLSSFDTPNVLIFGVSLGF